eukprot:5736461-Pleurochrysis_carterae.AAC.1
MPTSASQCAAPLQNALLLPPPPSSLSNAAIHVDAFARAQATAASTHEPDEASIGQVPRSPQRSPRSLRLQPHARPPPHKSSLASRLLSRCLAGREAARAPCHSTQSTVWTRPCSSPSVVLLGQSLNAVRCACCAR